MNLQYPLTYRIVLIVSGLVAALGMVFSNPQLELILFVVLMVGTGIPHGATDHVIDRFHRQQQQGSFSWVTFLLTYLGAMVLYGLAWYILPQLSLAIFILISAYHFGQSQFMFVRLNENHWIKQISYVSWGLLILGGIIGFHAAESNEVLAALWAQSQYVRWEAYFPTLMVVSGVLWLGTMVWFWRQGCINGRELGLEILHVGILLAICATTSLLVSFAIYFGLWHALASISHEIRIFRTTQPGFDLRSFVRQALPFSLLSFVGIGLLLWLGQWLGGYFSPYLLFFIAISTLTLPHMVYMQGFYQVGSKQSRTPTVG